MRRLGWVETGTPARASIEVVTLTYDDGAPGERSELYQLPLAFYAERQDRLNHAFVGWWEEPELGGYVHAYDAVHDRDAMAGWLRAFDRAAVRRTRSRSTGCRGMTSTPRPTRRCSPASSPTPRWPSATTRC